MSSMLSSFKTLLYPNKCLFCGKILPSECFACPACLEKLLRITELRCPHCHYETPFCHCKEHSYIEGVCAPFYYAGLVEKGIKRFKFKGRKDACVFFAKEMVKTAAFWYKDLPFDVVVGAPMSDKKKKSRGYNQADELARQIALCMHIPYTDRMLREVRETKTQHNLNREERLKNRRNAYEVCLSVTHQRILLVDDIITTGSTLNECARVLKEKGALEVWCLVAAETQ